MQKAELLTHIKSRLYPSLSPHLLGLLLSFVNQCETETVEIEQFLEYLKKNLLRIVKDQLSYRPQNFFEIMDDNLAVAYEPTALLNFRLDSFGFYRGEPVIHLAARELNISAIKSLVESGADINILYKTDSMGGKTPLMYLISHNRKLASTETEFYIQQMLELGADIHFKNDSNQTALDIALSNHAFFNWVKSLLKHGVSFDQENLNYFSESTDSSSCNDVEKLLRKAKTAERKEIERKEVERKDDPLMGLIQDKVGIKSLANIIYSYFSQSRYGYFKNNKQLFIEEDKEQSAPTPWKKCVIQ